MARNDIGPRRKDVSWRNLLDTDPSVPIQLDRNSLPGSAVRGGPNQTIKSGPDRVDKPIFNRRRQIISGVAP